MVPVDPAAMKGPGYSDRINHALAFAAKHHDQQVRRGNRPPYSVKPANIALILTRYGCDDDTVIAGILLDVVDDYDRAGFSREELERRIGDKFGGDVVDIAAAATPRRANDDDIEFSPEERREDFLARIGLVAARARWVGAASVLHEAASLHADLGRTLDPTSVWSRYTGGRVRTVDWYRRVCQRLRDVGFDAPILSELADAVAALEAFPVDAGEIPRVPSQPTP
jgi:hypothetical protein